MSENTVYLVGGSATLREELGVVLGLADFNVDGDFDNTSTCWALAKRDPDLVLILLSPDTATSEEPDPQVLLHDLRQLFPGSRLVIVASASSRALQQTCIDAGADSFLPLSMPADAFCQSLRVIMLGQSIFVAGIRPAWQRRQVQILMQSACRKQDRRVSARKRTLIKAQLVFNDSHCQMDCTVLDISETGAKIRPADLASLPERFELRIQFGTHHACEVVRRSANYLGVRFLKTEVPNVEAAPSWKRFATFDISGTPHVQGKPVSAIR